MARTWEEKSGGVTAPQGFLAAGVAAGVKYKGRRDIALIFSEVPARAAGVFTTNLVKGAPVVVTMERIARGRARAVVVNSGNANTCNGEQGIRDARAMAQETARVLNIPEEDVLVASTGVIGQPMPMDRILPGIAAAARELSSGGGAAAAEAIMTTDTEPKETALSLPLSGHTVTIGGMAKGSGMIHPSMATMLCFITTDAAVSAPCLQEMLRHAVDRSFNMISVDGDTSTNDMVLALANGRAGNPEIAAENEDYHLLRDALTEVCTRLARAVARDGEGATKLLEVKVINAASEKDARLAARAVVASNLVKTAIYGQDANWGRIICAAGYSGAHFDPDRVDIYLGDIMVARDGVALPFDEEAASSVLAGREVRVLVDLKSGEYEATAWGCDLTGEYVNINASYRT
ncbi:bifunctional glutamate N-acetyltransferase/amino-acid acetyltransferase ArgJ [Desulfofundulus sp. TPOSR]|uniref:bifunctional glutamate N-acetyltransferase/amino-acid acetyltransferase ArgJ n=1 Tax=Desulfofundulus sp. TPOSR TaxID=2714340 RepID=UPI00140A3520|nr:bifunctional glutamate N-acetyltransferase/amino-acid acetyltransferase ArgJ [Desulfofundulus sp. TPOSR]NHM26377.1 bifunctional glutamate N-acetyltransferase/amino-acid acetyltransferase ArgJ [Desulfofundulus sp. TPOSR]